MARSRRLTDGRWRTFMRLLRLDDLMAYYTNAGAPELASSRQVSTIESRLVVSCILPETLALISN